MEWTRSASVVVESSWQKVRESVESTTATDPIAAESRGVDPLENVEVGCQTGAETEADAPRTDAKDVKIEEATLSLFLDAFRENERLQKPLKRYDDFRAASQKLVLVETKQLDLPKNAPFPVVGIECGQNGRAAILYGERSHESWCAHDGRVVLWHYRQADSVHLASCPTVARYGKLPYLLAVGAASGQILLIGEGEMLSTNQVHRYGVAGLEWLGAQKIVSAAVDGEIVVSAVSSVEQMLNPLRRLSLGIGDLPRTLRRAAVLGASTGVSAMCLDAASGSIFVAGDIGAIWSLDLKTMKASPAGADPDGIDALLHNMVYVTPSQDVKWMSDAMTAEPLGIRADRHCSSTAGICVFSNDHETIVYDLKACAVIYHDSQHLQAAGFSPGNELVVIDDQWRLRWFDIRKRPSFADATSESGNQKPMAIPRIRTAHAALCVGQFALSLMQAMFMFYYVKVFLNVLKLDQWWFNVAQALFMVWNAVNDPLFGYIQDTSKTWMSDKRKVFTNFGPLMAASFAFLWIPFDRQSGGALEGLHLIIGLFLYDAFYSCVGVAWSALFAESRERVTAMKFSQFAILISINILPVAERVSHSLDNFEAFQCLGIAVAIVSGFCLFLVGTYQSKRKLLLPERLLDDEGESMTSYSFSGVLKVTKEIVFARDFQCLAAINFIHNCRSVAHLNFASIATEILIPETYLAKGSFQMSAFYAVCTLAPQLVVILSGDVVNRQGPFRMMMLSFVTSVLSALGFFFFSSHPYLIMLFMFVDSITVHSAGPLFNVLFAEFIDDDAKRHNRKSPLSSLIFSINALVVKPAQSLAPVAIITILNLHDYGKYKTDHETTADLYEWMKLIIYSTPFLLGGAQWILFRRYTLKHRNIVTNKSPEL
ncbi:hypothetical protein QR680_009180 [Steinernema hermaphroditum]|uniref:Uncharacterized protein n=1 Tax=Steinernema hermaphroditum TaxID=289476 RepID=A0AA39ILP9_9BILA|nr:hypothetical protein QR680_009180 [Steinernema hermaphroditum]